MGEPVPVTIKFDEDRYNEDKRVFVVKMSLPASWAAKPAAKILKYYVKKFNENYPDDPVDAAKCRIMIDRDRTIINLETPVANAVAPHDELTISLDPEHELHEADLHEAALQDKLPPPKSGKAVFFFFFLGAVWDASPWEWRRWSTALVGTRRGPRGGASGADRLC